MILHQMMSPLQILMDRPLLCFDISLLNRPNRGNTISNFENNFTKEEPDKT